MSQQLETRVADQMLNVGLRAGKEIVDTNDICTFGEKLVAKMRA